MLAAWFLALPAAARAHETSAVHLHAFGELGCRLLDGDAFLAVRPGLVLEGERGHLVIAPLLHYWFDSAGRVRLRAEDLEVPSDYGRFLYSVKLQGARSRWSLKAGALAHQRLGSGAVVNDFVASLDPDAWATALRFDLVAGDFAWLEVLAGDIFAPGLLAARLSAAPMEWAGVGHWAARSWEVGVLAAADPAAPVELTGELEAGRRPGSRTGVLAVGAVDTKIVLYQGDRVSFSPYADAAVRMLGPSKGRGGLHLGMLSDLRLAPRASLVVRGEARRLGTGYMAEHFDTWYSLERWGFPAAGRTPKAVAEELEGGWGGKGEIVFAGDGLGLVAFAGDWRPGGPVNSSAHLELGGDTALTGAVHLAARGFGWLEEEMQSLLGLGEVRYRLTDAVYLVARGGRVFRVDEESARYRPAWDAALAVGGAI